jgi:hypothetical protein
VVDGILKANGTALNESIITKGMIGIWIGLISFLLAIAWTYKKSKQTHIQTQ